MTISTQSSTTLNKSFLRRILQAFIDIRELTLIVLITAIIIECRISIHISSAFQIFEQLW